MICTTLLALETTSPPALAQPLRVPIPMKEDAPPKVDPRCAAEGPGFIYLKASRTCLRIGGLVGIEAGRGQTNNLLPR